MTGQMPEKCFKPSYEGWKLGCGGEGGNPVRGLQAFL